jgi:molybdopterin molybdotransferase
MPEFLTLLPPQEALQRLFSAFSPRLAPELVPLSQALGRVTAEPITALHPLPSFTRSTVDGYAVRAEDTYGASESLPAFLRLSGEVRMGEQTGLRLNQGECALIHTGGMLPLDASAVVMLEYTQEAAQAEIEILRAVAAGENVLKIGEDVRAGEVVIPQGCELRPAEIGGLAALGIIQVPVSPQPRAGIISSGDEVVPVDAELRPGQVRDVNTHTLSALIARHGGVPISYGVLPDRRDVLEQTARLALSECDLVIFTAGSSASARDLTAEVIASLGQPGVLVHGVNVKPGKPTILGVCGGKVVIGLPGNPVSALVIAGLFVVPVIQRLMGKSPLQYSPGVPARLSLNIASQAGREDWVPVCLRLDDQGYLAEPVFAKSNLIFNLSRANGMIRIPPEATGLPAGAAVQVMPL